MFKLTVVLAGVAFVVPANAQATCPKGYTRADWHRVARQVYDGKAPATRFERRTLARVTRCQDAPRKARPILTRHQVRYRRHHLRQLRWVYYRAHPMPYCTWAYESGVGSGPEYAPSPRYRVVNTSSSAAGKYQVLDSTWTAYGGTYRGYHSAAASPPLEQEKIARRVYAGQGIGAWAAC